MKKILIGIVVVLLVLIGIGIANQKSGVKSDNQSTTSIINKISAADGQIIDVRTSEEYLAGHADGAINVPIDDILNGDLSKIHKNNPIYVYCRTGKRADRAKAALEKDGYKNVTNIGGLDDWVAKGGEVCTSKDVSC